MRGQHPHRAPVPPLVIGVKTAGTSGRFCGRYVDGKLHANHPMNLALNHLDTPSKGGDLLDQAMPGLHSDGATRYQENGVGQAAACRTEGVAPWRAWTTW
ncbi:hypothetical protein RKD45_002263 [Streptomyces griseus]